jgi:hypothetical protein
MKQGKIDFRYPRLNKRIQVIKEGFNPGRTGIYIGNTPSGQMILDMDPNDLLPPEYKIEIISITDNFKEV